MNVLKSGSSLKPGDFLTSPNGTYRLELQTDGNLVLSGPTGPAWDSKTWGQPVVTADMQADGNFVLYTADHGVVWRTDTADKPGAHLVLQDDRNVVIYAADGTVVLWSPNCYVTDAEKAAEEQAARAAEDERRRAEEAARAAAPAPEPRRYTVERGDTLSAIAKRFYGRASEYRRIAAANGIADPDLIHPGQQLVIPD